MFNCELNLIFLKTIVDVILLFSVIKPDGSYLQVNEIIENFKKQIKYYSSYF